MMHLVELGKLFADFTEVMINHPDVMKAFRSHPLRLLEHREIYMRIYEVGMGYSIPIAASNFCTYKDIVAKMKWLFDKDLGKFDQLFALIANDIRYILHDTFFLSYLLKLIEFPEMQEGIISDYTGFKLMHKNKGLREVMLKNPREFGKILSFRSNPYGISFARSTGFYILSPDCERACYTGYNYNKNVLHLEEFIKFCQNDIETTVSILNNLVPLMMISRIRYELRDDVFRRYVRDDEILRLENLLNVLEQTPEEQEVLSANADKSHQVLGPILQNHTGINDIGNPTKTNP